MTEKKVIEEVRKDEMMRIRNVISLMAALLPFTLLLFNGVFGQSVNPDGVMVSISATHYSTSYGFFEFLVAGMGFFLLFYKGYDIQNRIFTIIAGVSALFVAFFPTELGDLPVRNFLNLSGKASGIIHSVAALIFFGVLVYITAFEFTKTDKTKKLTFRKKVRNNIYYGCSIIMVLGLLIGGALALFRVFPNGIFWGEAVYLCALSFAWLTKAGKILKDIEPIKDIIHV